MFLHRSGAHIHKNIQKTLGFHYFLAQVRPQLDPAAAEPAGKRHAQLVPKWTATASQRIKSARLVGAEYKILRFVGASALLSGRSFISGRPDFDKARKRRSCNHAFRRDETLTFAGQPARKKKAAVSSAQNVKFCVSSARATHFLDGL